MEIVTKIFLEAWHVLLDSAPYMLFGFLVAGLLKAFLPDDMVARHLGGNRAGSVVKAALLGAPIPLCSCGVVPAAAGLRAQGAGKGATAAFLTATPETGPDSMAITYALLDPLMTLFRPVAAVISAIIAGLGVNRMEKNNGSGGILPSPSPAPSCGCSGCGCEMKPIGWREKLKNGMSHAFVEMPGDIGPWFLGGVLLAGLITALIPDGFIRNNLGSGMLSMLIMLVAGIPMYVCATSSTPIAAALALKGLSPGAALVFLLAGPATNAATMAVSVKILGRKAAIVQVAAIAFSALGLGLLANYLYGVLGMDVSSWAQGSSHEGYSTFTIIAAIGLVLLMIWSMIRLKMIHRHGHNHHGHDHA